MLRRRPRAATTGITVATVLALAAVAGAPAATAADRTHGRHHDRHHTRTQQAMDAFVEAGGVGLIARVQDRHGTWAGSSGVADLETGRPRVRPDRFRIGSITKTFVATVLLQLQEEGRLDLDDPVEKWLPGVVRGGGHDGRAITVRRLLNHTSGVHDYTSDPEFRRKVFEEGFFEHRHDTWTPGQLVAIAMSHEPAFEPGTDWEYSNTNYVLAGMIVEEVTGRSYADEIERRVIRPLGLRATELPGTRASMPRPHGRGYGVFDEGGGPRPVDVTEVNPSIAGAAGEMISTVDDLDRFLRALDRGRLLSAESKAQMFASVPVGEGARDRYGLGVQIDELSCGVRVWGHSGGIHGSTSLAVSAVDGDRRMTVNSNSPWVDFDAVVEAEFCGVPPRRAGDSGEPAAQERSVRLPGTRR